MVCIVSAFYKIPSKQPFDFYVPHLIRWFKGVSGNVIFFTTIDVIEYINKFVNTSHVKIIYMSFEHLISITNFDMKFWEKQYSRDPERYHSPELGFIWYCKKIFVELAQTVVKDDNVFIWCDAGCIRDDNALNALKNFGKRNFIELDNNTIYIQQIRDKVYSDFYMYPNICIAGAIIAGNRKAWKEFKIIYDEVLCEYDKNQVSGIMDQNIISSCVDRNKNLFTIHKDTPKNVDEWFKFLEIF